MKKLILLLFSALFISCAHAQDFSGNYRAYDVRNYKSTINLFLFKDTFRLSRDGGQEGITGRIKKISDSIYSLLSLNGNSEEGTLTFTRNYAMATLTHVSATVSDSLDLLLVTSLYRQSKVNGKKQVIWDLQTQWLKRDGGPGIYFITGYDENSEVHIISQCRYVEGRKDGKEEDYYSYKEVKDSTEKHKRSFDAQALDSYPLLKCTGKWKEGLKKGKWKYYDLFENVTRTEHYKKGMLIKTKTYHSKNDSWKT